MALVFGGWPIRRRFDYARYLLGLTRSEHVFNTGPIRRMTVVIPDSLGDVAINASVTRYYKEHIPDVHISLITHPRYVAAGELVPEYDEVYGYGPPFADIPCGELTHRQQVNIARLLTPEMDRLYLCQPSAWCDAISAKYTMIEMQNRLCKVPEGVRHQPRLSLPSDAADRARRLRARHPGPAVFMAHEAYTIRFGAAAREYCRRVAEWCVSRGVYVYWNAPEAIVAHDRLVAVGKEPLSDAVALATLSSAVISMRSGLSDLVGFVAKDLPHLVLYPPGNYPYSRLSWQDWCSLRAMGVAGALEQVNGLDTPADADRMVERTISWLRGLPGLEMA